MSNPSAINPAEHTRDKVRERQAKMEKRCESCGALLFNHKNIQGAGTIEEKCHKCGQINKIEISNLVIK